MDNIEEIKKQLDESIEFQFIEDLEEYENNLI